MTKPNKLLALVGCVLAASCSSPVPVDDGGQAQMDSGTEVDGGGGPPPPGLDSGTEDGGPTSDAGCMGTAAAQLGFASAPQMLDARSCSAPLKVQLQTACGAPVNTAGDLTVSFTATGPTTELFGDSACIGKPSSFVIPNGANTLEVYFRDPASGMSTISVTAAGVDGGSQLEVFACPAGEKPCNGDSCIPNASCCTSADCTAPKLCNGIGQCHVPSCSGFPANCSSSDFVVYDGGLITLGSGAFNPKCVSTSTFGSVKYSGSLHKPEQTCGPKDVTISSFGSTHTVTGQSSFGTYGFHCANHPTSTFEVGALKTP